MENLLALARSQPDLAAQARLSEFACVRTSGLLEVSVHTILAEYARRRSTPGIAAYVSRRLERTTNLQPERLYTLLGDFTSQWRTRLEEFMRGDRSEAIRSVVNNRNQIAHGKSVSVGVSQVQLWLQSVTEVVEFIGSLADE